jgi:VanZ family protein
MESRLGILRRLAVWLFWPGLVLVVWGELTPTPPPVMQDFWDKGEHFIAYIGLAAMATLVIGRRPALGWALAGITALGGMLEIVQGMVGRDASMGDFLANTLGVLAGWSVGLVVIWLGDRKLLVGRTRAE